MAKRKEDRAPKPPGKENELNQKQNDAQELRPQFGVAWRAGVVHNRALQTQRTSQIAEENEKHMAAGRRSDGGTYYHTTPRNRRREVKKTGC
jgi:hypothetical protein